MAAIVFHVGLHKTGTKWLQMRYFAAHPLVHLANDPLYPREDPLMTYLVTTEVGRYDAAHFRKLVDERIAGAGEGPDGRVVVFSSERLAGHPFSGGFDRRRIAERIRAAVPDGRILVTVRDQPEIIESVYKQFVRQGYPGSIRDLWDARPWISAGFSRSFYCYDELAELYRGLFGAANVRILRYEERRNDPVAYLRSVCAFLGVPFRQPTDEAERVNPSLSDEMVAALRHVNRLRRSEFNPFPVVHLARRPRKYLARAIALPGRLRGRGGEIMGPAFREEVRACYAASNARLRELLDPQPMEARDPRPPSAA